MADLLNRNLELLVRSFQDFDADYLVDRKQLQDNIVRIFSTSFKLIVNESPSQQYIRSLKSNLNDYRYYIVITENLSADQINFLKTENINFISSSAQIFIDLGYLKISNNLEENFKPQPADIKPQEPSSANLLRNSALKVILTLLSVKDAVQLPLRRVATLSNVSLGSCQTCFKMLEINSFIFKTPRGRFLKNCDKLLEIWVQGFNMLLKHKYFLGTARCRYEMSLDGLSRFLDGTDCEWGGEPAAYILDRYLKPENYSIFSWQSFVKTCTDCELIPDPKGNVRIYRRFWNNELVSEKGLAPKLVVYAQLMGSNDSRCIEAAQRLLQSEDICI